MTTFKAEFRPVRGAEGQGDIYFQIICGRDVRLLEAGCRVAAVVWDARRGRVVVPLSGDRAAALAARQTLALGMARLTRIVRRLDDSGVPYTADDVADEFRRYAGEYTLFAFMGAVTDRLKEGGRERTAEAYVSALNSFRAFRNGVDVALDCVTADLVDAYWAWLRRRGVVPNTVSFYARILRAVYSRAVERDIVDDARPFRHIYTGIDKTVKRALPLATIRKLKELDLSGRPALDYARDMFLMSFYLRGMSFVDMAFLRKSDLAGGAITYRRRKTGRRLIIAWTAEMQQILSKYPDSGSDYLLPVLTADGGRAERSAYRNAGYNINHNLKRVAEYAGIGIPLTLYVARHSWASAARAKNIPLAVISEGLGHDSEATTQIYLAGLDTAVVDKANSLILKSLG